MAASIVRIRRQSRGLREGGLIGTFQPRRKRELGKRKRLAQRFAGLIDEGSTARVLLRQGGALMSTPLIDAYSHCPLCGSTEYALQRGRTRRCAKCGHQDFNNPITAVAALILDADDQLLLIRRAREPSKGKLAMPGGFVDAGESLETAVQREVEEEIGLTLTSLRYLCSGPNQYVYHDLARPVCDVFFEASTRSFDVVMQESEVAGWELAALTDIAPEALAFDSMRAALEILIQRRRS